MMILFFLYLIFVPFFMGTFIRKIIDPKGQNLADDYISGFLTLIVMSGVIQLVAIILDYSFKWYCNTLLIASSFMGLVGLILSAMLQTYPIKDIRRNFNERLKAINRNSNSFGLFLIGFLFAALLGRILLTSSSLEGDFTLETINTSLATNTIYKYNSLTGAFIEGGMPIRQQILTLPILMGFFSNVFGIEATTIVLKIFPCVVALLCFLVCHRIGDILYPDAFEKRVIFVGIFAFMMLVGDYAAKSPAYLLIYQGFGGYAFLTNVCLPYLFTAFLRRKWLVALLCLGCEIFIVWTTYGVGFGVVMVVFFIVSFLIRNVIRKAPLKTKEQTNKV